MRLLFCTYSALLLLAAAGFAKCPSVSYEVHGRVERASTGKPLGGGEVIGFFDDYHNAIGEHAERPARATIDAQGGFVLRGVFDSYQGYSWWGHNCAGSPERLEVIILSVDHSIERFNFGDNVLKKSGKGTHRQIVLPTIRMDR